MAVRARRALLNEGLLRKPYVAQPSSSPLALDKGESPKTLNKTSLSKVLQRQLLFTFSTSEVHLFID